ncbi:MAG: dienelactone hydrolase family protein [Rhodospirillaceae bacterium]|nr:dienelactone hydrolase family protein [Rhodospirillaceae bacterium]
MPHIIPDIIYNGPIEAKTTIVLTHGAGAPMDTPFMDAFADGLAGRGFRVARFEFPYMAERRTGGPKRPPNKADVLLETWSTVIDELGNKGLIIGGKSMGGRMASMVADDAGVLGLVCLGYPFHGFGKVADEKRLGHLVKLKTPTLICQGTRDTMGNADDVSGYELSPAIEICWLEDGDHGFKPRKKSGRTERQNWAQAIDGIASFAAKL